MSHQIMVRGGRIRHESSGLAQLLVRAVLGGTMVAAAQLGAFWRRPPQRLVAEPAADPDTEEEAVV